MSILEFRAKWNEELACTGPGGSLVLELTMGVLTAYLPSEDAFRSKAPFRAANLWPQLRDELAQWCFANKAEFVVDPTSRAYQWRQRPTIHSSRSHLAGLLGSGVERSLLAGSCYRQGSGPGLFIRGREGVSGGG